MSALAKDAAAFKSTLSRQDYTSWRSQPAAAVLAAGTEPPASSAGSKKKRPKTSMFLLLIQTRLRSS